MAARRKEANQRLVKAFLKNHIESNETFSKAEDAYKKNKRLHTEASNLLTDTGFDKELEKLNERIKRIEEQKATLESKRDVAKSSVDALSASLTKFEEARSALVDGLRSKIDLEDMPSDEEIKEAVDSTVESLDLEGALTSNDVFSDFRRTKKTETTEETTTEE